MTPYTPSDAKAEAVRIESAWQASDIEEGDPSLSDLIATALLAAFERGRMSGVEEAENAVNGKAYGDAVEAIRALIKKEKQG